MMIHRQSTQRSKIVFAESMSLFKEKYTSFVAPFVNRHYGSISVYQNGVHSDTCGGD